ncbi:LysE family translocator [Culturomica massiliensis]|uniref:LysE family translocator n=1 Tax=Culturomica massiliensis TaxID=1841857 RepID=UPI00266EEEE4|nr:LysE family translocator [Culturomica massiliensis]
MNLGGFISAAVLLTLMPGPDILFVITQGVTRGRKAAVVFAAGLCTGLLFHIAAVTLGVSALVAGSDIAFTVFKFAGAAYLIGLGVKAFFNRNRVELRFTEEGKHTLQLYKRGILMNILNPKVILFFLAFFPQFIDIRQGDPIIQMLVLGGVFIVQALVVFSAVAVLADRLSAGFMKNPRVAYWMNWAEVVIYTAIGISIFFI